MTSSLNALLAEYHTQEERACVDERRACAQAITLTQAENKLDTAEKMCSDIVKRRKQYLLAGARGEELTDEGTSADEVSAAVEARDIAEAFVEELRSEQVVIQNIATASRQHANATARRILLGASGLEELASKEIEMLLNLLEAKIAKAVAVAQVARADYGSKRGDASPLLHHSFGSAFRLAEIFTELDWPNHPTRIRPSWISNTRFSVESLPSISAAMRDIRELMKGRGGASSESGGTT